MAYSFLKPLPVDCGDDVQTYFYYCIYISVHFGVSYLHFTPPPKSLSTPVDFGLLLFTLSYLLFVLNSRMSRKTFLCTVYCPPITLRNIHLSTPGTVACSPLFSRREALQIKHYRPCPVSTPSSFGPTSESVPPTQILAERKQLFWKRSPNNIKRERLICVHSDFVEMERSTALLLFLALVKISSCCLDPLSAYRFTGAVCRLTYPAAVVCKYSLSDFYTIQSDLVCKWVYVLIFIILEQNSFKATTVQNNGNIIKERKKPGLELKSILSSRLRFIFKGTVHPKKENSVKYLTSLLKLMLS